MVLGETLQIITEPRLRYAALTRKIAQRLTAQDAEEVVIGLLAERARIREGGTILAWSEFNENPDPLVNTLIARILVAQMSRDLLKDVTAPQIAVLSIENSAGYLATAVTLELENQLRLARPPRIIRARKSDSNKPPSPAMGECFAYTTVFPITAGGVPRNLVASFSELQDLMQVKLLLVVDDFRATGSTLQGGVILGVDLLTQSGVDIDRLVVVPMAGLGKPEQTIATSPVNTQAHVTDILTAVDVRFWPDALSGHVLIQANGYPLYKMHQAAITDFKQK